MPTLAAFALSGLPVDEHGTQAVAAERSGRPSVRCHRLYGQAGGQDREDEASASGAKLTRLHLRRSAAMDAASAGVAGRIDVCLWESLSILAAFEPHRTK